MKSGIFRRLSEWNDTAGYAEVEEANIRWHVQRTTEHLLAELEAMVSASRSAEYECRAIGDEMPAEAIRQSAASIRKALQAVSTALDEAIGRADQLALCSALELASELDAQLRGHRIAPCAEGLGAA